MRRRYITVLAALTAALIAMLAIPAFASALATYKVDNNGDGSTKLLCETHITNECTLRGALEAAEADSGFDIIEFSIATFSGQVGEDEIVVGSTPLPAITQPLLMFGHPCEYPLFGYTAPCVGITAHTGEAALKVESSGVTIEHVAFGGGKYGIEASGAGTGLSAQSDWFGLKLDATANAISEAGIRLGPGADEATIGGTEASKRNVFAHAEVGVAVEGASKTAILGNYIGVGPTGLAAAGLGVGVRIVDKPGSPAEENEVGGELTAAQASSPQCDGPCNVIVAVGGKGIELADETGDAPPTGPTTISGNYLGLSADGNSQVGSGGANIYAGPSFGGSTVGPAHVTVGGSAAAPGASKGNYIDGDEVGVYVENADGFLAEGNILGWLPGKDESGGSGPADGAFVLVTKGVTESPEITQNEMHLGPGAIGVESEFEGAGITFNVVEGSETGVQTKEDDGGNGNLIRANEFSGPHLNGVLIENDANLVIGNRVVGAGQAGIEVNGDPGKYGAHNRIGGDASGEANRIEGSTESAIHLGGVPATHNEVAGNYGSGNGGPFILLAGHEGPHPPNGEIKPPTLEVVEESKASGTAEPGAKVRIFSKASSEAGELGALIGAATADSSGHWTATYPKLAVGELVAATQTSAPETSEGATSEVSTPKAAVADHKEEEGGSGGGGSGGGGSTGGGSPNPTPTPVTTTQPTAPKVTITKGPKKSSTSTTAKFKFKAEPAAGATFECKLDRSKWAKCKSPKAYKKLKAGTHTFQVRAVAGGQTGAATKFKFMVKT